MSDSENEHEEEQELDLSNVRRDWCRLLCSCVSAADSGAHADCGVVRSLTWSPNTKPPLISPTVRALAGKQEGAAWCGFHIAVTACVACAGVLGEVIRKCKAGVKIVDVCAAGDDAIVQCAPGASPAPHAGS